MINKINFAQGIQQVQARPAFKAKETDNETVTNPDSGVSFKGAEALANYNKPNVMAFDKSILEVEPILPTVIQPDAIGSIEGEKIYGSNGKLNSIVNRVGDKVVVYTASAENDNMIESIVTTDKKTGNVIKEQRNEIEDGKYVYMNVAEFNPETGKRTRITEFVNGELDYASKTSTNERGMTQDVAYDFKNGHYTVSESTADGKFYRTTEFNKNKELISIYEHKNSRGSEVRSEVNFYNGAVISSDQRKSEVLPNNMGREVLNDTDVTPADLSVYPDSIEGEKTFYSNGSLESVTAGDLVYHYSPQGDVTFIEDGNKTVEVKNTTTTIKENLDEGAAKTTKYFEDGFTVVDYEKGDYHKHITINNGNPSYYYEDNGDRTIRSFDFNEKGMLVSAWGDDI